MGNELKNVYFAKNTLNGEWTDITELFDGVRILKITGFMERGNAVNIYTAKWIDSQMEDFMITKSDENENPIVIRENVDIEITFIVKQKYASATIDVLTQHDLFIDYMTNSDVWISSSYVNNKYVHCVSLESYKPTTIKLQRGIDSWVMGTIKLHALDAPMDWDESDASD